MRKWSFLWIILAAFSFSLASVEVPCKVGDFRYSSGICKEITECPSALGLWGAGVKPTVCNTADPIVKVCCPTDLRISARKCKEFSTVLTRPIKSNQALSYDSTSNEKETNGNNTSIKCESFLIGFIVGGRNTRAREYPYQVALGYGDPENPDWRCGGVLVDKSAILTAGHCVKTAFGPPKVVLMGDRHLRKKKDLSRVVMNVSETFIHPNYKPPLQYNDIAVIKLADEVKLSRAVLPACLPDPQDRLDKTIGVEATGWGNTGAFDNPSDTLRSVTLAKFDTPDCSSFFQSDAESKKRLPTGIQKSQFCAGDKHGFGDTCKGDSGGPVTVTKENGSCVHYVVGITSFGSNLCGYQQPGIYTNILSFLDWIEDVVWYNYSTSSESSSKLDDKMNPNSDKLIFNINPSQKQPNTNTDIPEKKMETSTTATVLPTNKPVIFQSPSLSPKQTTNVTTFANSLPGIVDQKYSITSSLTDLLNRIMG